MKSKIIAVILTVSILGAALSGCAVKKGPEGPAASGTNDNPAIVVTSVAIAEILDRLDYDNVIGVPESERTLPERYRGAKTVGAPMNPDLEIIKSLSPDMVLSPKTLESSLSAQYQNAGITSAFLDLASIEGMYGAISSLGKLLGRETQAAALTEDYGRYLADYGDGKTEDPDVLLLMCFPDGFFLASTEESYVGNLVKLAGGKNVYAGQTGDNEGFLNINPEDMVQKAPDKILVFAHYNEEAAFEYMRNEFATNSAWQYFDAVKNGQVYYLPSDVFGMSATLSWKDALECLEPILYQ